MRISDWSSDVCSSDLGSPPIEGTEITLAVRVVVLTEIRVAGDDGHEFHLPRGGEQRIVINHRQNALRHHHDIRRGTVQIGAQLIVENRNALAVVRKLLRSEEHTSELQSLMRISYADTCLK